MIEPEQGFSVRILLKGQRLNKRNFLNLIWEVVFVVYFQLYVIRRAGCYLRTQRDPFPTRLSDNRNLLQKLIKTQPLLIREYSGKFVLPAHLLSKFVE